MRRNGNFKVLFVAGFGPIVREDAESHRLYSQMMGIDFTAENDNYLHTEALQGAKTFALWPLRQVAQSCFGKDTWPRRSLNRKATKCSSRTRRNLGGRQ